MRGRLEPGTSVVNGSLFDNICRGWWWGRKERRPGLPRSKTWGLLSSTSRPTTKKERGSSGKRKKGSGIFHQCPTPSVRPSRPQNLIKVSSRDLSTSVLPPGHRPKQEIPLPETSASSDPDTRWPRLTTTMSRPCRGESSQQICLP